jgi:WhiB family redox-sensing transcriptional regulator
MSSVDLSTNGFLWRGEANCVGFPTEMFFPGRGASVKEAKAVCSGCKCRESCLQYALDNHGQIGIWGGTSERERRSIRRLRVKAI